MSRVAFIVVSIAFAAATIWLAAITMWPGTHDSCHNLDTARNLAEGRGFVSHVVQHHFTAQSFPNPEKIRPPGAPFVVSLAFRLLGYSLAIPVLINGACVLLSAWVLWLALRFKGAGPWADLGGIALLVSSCFEILSFWNNNFLVLATTLFLLVWASGLKGRWLIASCIAISLFGVLMKPTFIVAALPFSIFLTRSPLVGVSVLALIPFFGSPHFAFRLSERYGDDTFHLVRIDQPMTYSDVAARIGWGGILKTEGKAILSTAARLLGQNPLIAIAAIVALYRRKEWGIALLALEPIFTSAFYWHPETRFLWPVFPVAIVLAWLATRDGMRWKTVAVTLVIAWGAFQSQKMWRGHFQSARRPAPEWVEVVRRTPPDAVILTDDPWSVAWYADRNAVIAPADHEDRILSIYHPTYRLYTGRDRKGSWTFEPLKP